MQTLEQARNMYKISWSNCNYSPTRNHSEIRGFRVPLLFTTFGGKNGSVLLPVPCNLPKDRNAMQRHGDDHQRNPSNGGVGYCT